MKKNLANNVLFFLAQVCMVLIWAFTFGMTTVVIHIGHDVASVIQGWSSSVVELNFEVETPND